MNNYSILELFNITLVICDPSNIVKIIEVMIHPWSIWSISYCKKNSELAQNWTNWSKSRQNYPCYVIYLIWSSENNRSYDPSMIHMIHLILYLIWSSDIWIVASEQGHIFPISQRWFSEDKITTKVFVNMSCLHQSFLCTHIQKYANKNVAVNPVLRCRDRTEEVKFEDW